MRFRLLVLLLVGLMGTAFGQEKVVQTFEGAAPLDTASFHVQDKWEVRWDCPDVVAITVFSADGTIVAGASSAAKGSLYQPKGGDYRLQITRAGGESRWHVSVVELGPGTPGNDTNAMANYVPPGLPLSTGATNSVGSAPVPPAPAVTASPAPPAPAAAAPTPAPPAATGQGLSADQGHAIVVIKGDVAEGTGFLVHTANGPAVVTNSHVIAANANVKILTTTGEAIKTLGLQGATDRDLVMFKIQDDHYSYLDLATDIQGTVSPGDEVNTPGNSEGGEVVLDTKGTILGIGPEQIEISNPIYHGNSGGPVVHVKTGKVLAVVTMARKVDTSNALDKASFENKNSAIAGAMRYFALRIDTVPQWETLDWNRFLNETTFLKNFHQQSRCLDSYMNGARYESAHLSTTDENGPPDSRYFLRNEKIATAKENFHKFSTDADSSQRLDAGRELIMTLEGVANEDMDAIQNPTNFYAFNQLRAQHEIKYRKALVGEIEKMGDKMSDMGH